MRHIPLVLDDWDCVTTCFFIDTAHNIIEYVEFSPLGPLLYHFEDIPNEDSFEISYADLRTIILSCGFRIEVRLSSPPS